MGIQDLWVRMQRLPGIDEQGHALNGAQIRTIETQLDVVLPEDFKEFLSNVGHFSSRFFSFFGLHPEYPDHGLVALTLMNRAELEKARQSKGRRREELIRVAERWPQNAIVVNDGGDDSWYVLYSMDSDRPGEVAYLDGDRGWIEDETWPSFTAYLEECIKYAEEQAAEEKRTGIDPFEQYRTR